MASRGLGMADLQPLHDLPPQFRHYSQDAKDTVAVRAQTVGFDEAAYRWRYCVANLP